MEICKLVFAPQSLKASCSRNEESEENILGNFSTILAVDLCCITSIWENSKNEARIKQISNSSPEIIGDEF